MEEKNNLLKFMYLTEWIKVEDKLPERHEKVIAIFDCFAPEGDLVWVSTTQFIAYVDINAEWNIYGPVISYEAKRYNFIATHWMPEIAYPKEIIERNKIDYDF